MVKKELSTRLKCGTPIIIKRMLTEYRQFEIQFKKDILDKLYEILKTAKSSNKRNNTIKNKNYKL